MNKLRLNNIIPNNIDEIIKNNKYTIKSLYILNNENNDNLQIYINKISNIILLLKNLEKLEIIINSSIIPVPINIGTLLNLKYFRLSDTLLKKLPKRICNLVNLTELILVNNKLEKLSENIGNLVNLTELNISSNRLKNITKNIGNLVNINILILFNNKLKNLPESIGNLVKLINLDISENRLENIPESIGNLVNLNELELNNNKLKNLPESIGNLVNLSKIQLNNNKLIKLPESIGNLVNLTYLDLNNNELVELPESIGNLVKLVNLDVSENRLEKLPESIGNLVKLENCSLSDNRLEIIPESIGNLIKLINLDVNVNRLKKIPESIGNLINLEELNLDNNKLKKIPESISKLENLLTLNLDNNNLKNGAKTIMILKSLENMDALYITNNPPNFYYKLPENYKILESLSYNDIKDFEFTPSKRFINLARKKFPIKFMKWQELCLNPNIKLKILYDFLIDQAYQISIIKGEDKTMKDIKDIFSEKIHKKMRKYPNTKNMKNYDKRFICNLLVKVYNEYMSLKQEDFNRVCQSSDTLIGDEWIVVPFGDIVMYKSDISKKVYCFTVDELLSIRNGINPYNREPIPKDVILSAKIRKKFFSRSV